MTSITIRNVPDDVRDALAARAARSGRSLQAHVLAELTELARKPTVEEVLARARSRVSAAGSTLSASKILDHLAADRR
jgi:plasmid stability protein